MPTGLKNGRAKTKQGRKKQALLLPACRHGEIGDHTALLTRRLPVRIQTTALLAGKKMAPGTKPSRGGADFDEFVQKGGFGSLKINPVMGIKGRKLRLAVRRAQRKTHKQGSAFCPRATAEGMAGPGSAVHNRFLTWKQGRAFYGSTVRA